MSDEGKLSEEAARGARAKAIMQDEIFQEAFEGLRAHLLSTWMNTAPTQATEREYLWMQLQAAQDFQRALESVMDTGRMAVFQLDQKGEK